MEKGAPTETIPVTIDKSHIITIGERLYAESIEFIREIVNNAYDAVADAPSLSTNDARVVLVKPVTGGEGSDVIVGSALDNLSNTGTPFPVTAPGINDRYNINVPIENPAGLLVISGEEVV